MVQQNQSRFNQKIFFLLIIIIFLQLSSNIQEIRKLSFIKELLLKKKLPIVVQNSIVLKPKLNLAIRLG